MHDSTCQKLVVVTRAISNTDLPEETKSFLTAKLDECISDLHDMSRSLSLELLQSSGLVSAIEQEVDVLIQASIFNIDFTVNGEHVTLVPSKERMVFRIFQEAIQNAVKHSRATSVKVSLSFKPGQLILAVLDNGIGFDPAIPRGKGRNHMEARARVLHGNITFTCENPGMRVILTVPMEEEKS